MRLRSTSPWCGSPMDIGEKLELLAEQVPDATIEPFAEDDARADITVVLGASFSE